MYIKFFESAKSSKSDKIWVPGMFDNLKAKLHSAGLSSLLSTSDISCYFRQSSYSFIISRLIYCTCGRRNRFIPSKLSITFGEMWLQSELFSTQKCSSSISIYPLSNMFRNGRISLLANSSAVKFC